MESLASKQGLFVSCTVVNDVTLENSEVYRVNNKRKLLPPHLFGLNLLVMEYCGHLKMPNGGNHNTNKKHVTKATSIILTSNVLHAPLPQGKIAEKD